MIILGIETSCDETSAAVLENKGGRFKILSNLVSSQVKIHAKTWGVVPEVAAREHIKNILPISNQALINARKKPKDLSIIAVTAGPGLITSLLVGAETAKTLAYVWQKPLIGINHLEAHIYANFIENPPIKFPLLALVVSGGHTQIVLIKKYGEYKVIGQTRDDAAGEAFDKVAKLLKIGYPGGPIISRLAKKGNPNSFGLPRPMIREKNFDFSFAGLKTAVLYEVQSGRHDFKRASVINNLCASFQQAVVDVLVAKTIRAAERFKAKSVLLAGGVAANDLLRTTMKMEMGKKANKRLFAFKEQKKYPSFHLLLPTSQLCTDNAAMVAVAGYFHALKYDFTPWQKIKVNPNWGLE